MAEIEKAVHITKKLRSVIMKIVGLEKEKENYDASDDRIEDFFEEVGGDAGPAVELLAQVDTLLYDLMNYNGTGEAWIDADDVKSKEVLKMNEIIKRDSQFHLQNILISAAA